jgi:hypothetical protein
MPTGYTSDLMEKGQSFNEFIMGCAKQFGACVTMRDSSFDEPIPEEFKPSDWSIKELKKTQAQIKVLEAMTEEGKIKYGETKKNKRLQELAGYIEINLLQNKRIDAMLILVRQWVPPTRDHQGLKDFMIDQLNTSRHSEDYNETEIQRLKETSPLDIYNNEIVALYRSVVYCKEENINERRRVDSRNNWLKQLRNSIPKG